MAVEWSLRCMRDGLQSMLVRCTGGPRQCCLSVALVVVVAGSAGCDRRSDAGGDVGLSVANEGCNASQPSVGGDTILIGDVAPRCILHIDTMGVSLAGDGVNVPEPAPSVAIDSRGRYYSALNAGGGIGVWGPDGSFLRSVGRVGSGPGEFAEGWLGLFVGKDDNIVARDNSSNLLTFDSTLTWQRSIRLSIVAVPWYAHLLEDNRLLITHQLGGVPTHYFEVVNLLDTLPSGRRRFGEMRASDIRPRYSASRASSYVGDGVFWVAPIEGSEIGYQLERWSTDGQITRVLKRTVPWFPRPRALRQASRPDGQPPPPKILQLHAYGPGLLFVVIRVNDRRWRPLVERDSIDALQDELYDWRFEIIDSESGTVLASELLDSESAVPDAMFPGRPSGYIYEDDHPVSPRLRLVTLRLTERE